MCTYSEVTQDIQTTVHKSKTKDEHETKTGDVNNKYKKENEVNLGVEPKDAAKVTKEKSKKWSIFNKDTDEEKEQKKRDIQPEMVKTYSYGMKQTYYESIVVITDVINVLRTSNKTQQAVRNLRSAITMIEGIAEKINSPLPTDNIMSRFSTMSSIFTCMIDKTYKSMRDTGCYIIEKVKGFDPQLLERLGKETEKYMNMSVRISAVSIDALKKGKYATWGDIFDESLKEYCIETTDENVEIAGNAMSTVMIVGEGDDQLYYKDNVKVVRMDKAFEITAEKYCKGMEEKQKKYIMSNGESLYRSLYAQYYLYREQCIKNKPESFMNYIKNTDYIKKLKENEREIFLDIFEETYKLMVTLKQAKGIGVGVGESFAARNIAVTKMAQLMGMEDIVVSSQAASFVMDGEKTKGFVMSKAKGTDYSNIPAEYVDGIRYGKTSPYTGEFQRQLILLQILDNIMGQSDRHLNNIFYQTEKKDGLHYLVRLFL